MSDGVAPTLSSIQKEVLAGGWHSSNIQISDRKIAWNEFEDREPIMKGRTPGTPQDVSRHLPLDRLAAGSRTALSPGTLFCRLW